MTSLKEAGTAAIAPQREHVDMADVAYLRVVQAQAARAQQLEQEAAALEGQAGVLRRQSVALYGAHESFVEHLCLRYGLHKDTDRVDPETGLITRPPVADLGALMPGPPTDGPPNGTAS